MTKKTKRMKRLSSVELCNLSECRKKMWIECVEELIMLVAKNEKTEEDVSRIRDLEEKKMEYEHLERIIRQYADQLQALKILT